MDLRGKVALITGGGTGLGREIAVQLAREGMSVGVNYSRSEQDANDTVAELTEIGVKAIALQADLAQTPEATRLIQETERAFGRLDLLIHNAATTHFIPFTDLDAVDEERWDQIFNLNLKTAFFLARAAAPLLRQSRGQIISTSSVAGVSASGSSLPYSVSKAALIHLTKCLAVALAPEVRVNSVAPGLLLTRWAAGFGDDKLAAISERALLKRATGVDDTAAAFVMLAKNGSITGQTIVVDAGLLHA